MNILMVHPHDLFDKSEPWTIRIKSIAKEFFKQGHGVKICYFPLTVKKAGQRVHWEGIEVIPMNRTPFPATFILNTLKLIRLSSWCDIVHLQKCHHYCAVPTTLASFISCKPLHYDWDDWEEQIWNESCGKGLNARFVGFSFRVLEKTLLWLSDSVSCASDCLKQRALRSGVKKDFIFDSPVGADTEEFRPGLDCSWIKQKYGIDEKDHIILYVGQLHGAQYVDLFIRAANIVLQKCSKLIFVIAGEGFLENHLKRLVVNMGLTDKVIFTGAIPHNDIPYYINASSVCVASFEDTLVTRCKSPLKIVEYMACGRTVVASDVGEVREMIRDAGILTKAGDPGSLAEGIQLVLQDRNLRDALGLAARSRSEKIFNWKNTASNLIRAYSQILEKA